MGLADFTWRCFGTEPELCLNTKCKNEAGGRVYDLLAFADEHGAVLRVYYITLLSLSVATITSASHWGPPDFRVEQDLVAVTLHCAPAHHLHYTPTTPPPR